MAGAALSLPHVMKRVRPDACVAFFSVPGGPVALAANLVWKVPYVVSLRGGDVPGSESSLVWSHRILRPLRRAILRRSRAVVANSEGLRQLTERADPFPAIVIPSGVDASYFAPLDAGQAPTAFKALFVGRFHVQKNLPLLVEQFARSLEKAPDARLELVGDGPERSRVEARIAALGIGDRVALRGWLPRETLREAYREAGCLVNPSSGEGLPNVVLEAMACATPVVASRVAGNDTLVRDGQNGYLFDLVAPNGLGDAMARLALDTALRNDMGRRGREMALADYSWDSVAQRYAALFTRQAA
jgi:glycosyltransferase involved in cell wall biosynthesis